MFKLFITLTITGFIFSVPNAAYALEEYLLIDNTNKIVSRGYPQENVIAGDPDRQASLDNGGEIVTVPFGGDYWVGDTYVNDNHIPNSPERQRAANQIAERQSQRASAKAKLRGLGLTDEEVEALVD